MQTYDYKGTPLRLVPHEPDNGFRFYVSEDGKIGLRIAPTGVETLRNASPSTCENCKIKSDANRKQRYLQFKHAFGNCLNIYVSHAVYLAWVGPIPEDVDCIDHINGCTTDNRAENLEPVTFAENFRRAKYVRFMRKCDFDPRIFTAADFHHFFAMPLEEFKTFFAKYKDPAAHLAPFHKKDSSLYYVV